MGVEVDIDAYRRAREERQKLVSQKLLIEKTEESQEEPIEEFVTGELLLNSRTAKDPADRMYYVIRSGRL